MLRRILPALGFLASLWTAAIAQVPPPVPALPDTARITDYSVSNSTCACAVNFQIYGDQTDVDNWIQVQLNGTAVLSTDPTFGWKLTSPSGQLGSIARPITDAILTFNSPQTGTVQITGARRPRRLSQFPENRGVTARDLNVALTDIVAQNRENWDRGGGGGGGGGLPTLSPSTVLGNFAALPQTAGAQAVPPCAADGAHALTNSTGGGFGCTFVSNGTGTPTTPFVVTHGVTSRSAADRFNDRGLNIKEYGAIGDGNSHPLSGIYGSLAAAQAVYPFVSDLSQEVDWAAAQLAINTAFANGNLAVYCPAVPATAGAYILSNPLQLINPATGSGASAWAAGTTYANAATVLYNGIQWSSNGGGNIGNPPTSVNGYPGHLGVVSGSGNFTYANVAVSSASPAVVTLNSHGLSAGQPFVFLKQTYQARISSSTPALPTGTSANQVYYVLATGLTANTFEFSATPGGSAVNTSSTGVGVITISTQVWSWNAVGNSDFSSRATFIGDGGQGNGGNNNGCLFQYAGYNSPAFVVGAFNGNVVESIRVHGPAYQGSPYRCQMPSGSVGIGHISDGAGTHTTLIDKDEASGFSNGWKSNLGPSGTLGDSNTIKNGSYENNCIGLVVNSQENFINSAYDVTNNSNTTLLQSILGAGFVVSGGNYSSSSNASNVFTISSVTTSTSGNCTNGLCVQATISSPDGNLQWPLCGYNLQCVYTKFAIITPNFGNLPLDLDGYNPATGVIQLHVNDEWMSLWHNTCCSTIATDVAAATTLYAAEVVTVFQGGGITINGVHVENGVPTVLMAGTSSFGGGIPSVLSNINQAASAPLADFICCNDNLGNRFQSATNNFLVQDNLEYFQSGGSELILDGITGTGGNVNAWDRVLIGNGFNGSTLPIEFRHTMTSAQPMLIHSRATNGEFGDTFGLNDPFASQGFGVGLYDNSYPWLSAYGANPSNQYVPAFTAIASQPDGWRSIGAGTSPYWGVRPAAYSNPCITPSQVTALGSLPAITYSSTLHFALVNAGGTGYQNGDVLTVVGGTGTAAQITVDSTGASNSVFASHVSNNGNYTVEPTAPLNVTGGHGTGATFGAAWTPGGSVLGKTLFWHVHYTFGYPILWGGLIYHVCDYHGSTQTKYGVQQNGLGWSYFQNLTTTNVPNLSWQGFTSSPIIWMNPEALELMMPGLVVTLTPTGGGAGCTSNPLTAIVTEVHPTMGYVMVVNAGANGAPYLPQWSGTCTGTIIGQAAPSLVNPY